MLFPFAFLFDSTTSLNVLFRTFLTEQKKLETVIEDVEVSSAISAANRFHRTFTEVRLNTLHFVTIHSPFSFQRVSLSVVRLKSQSGNVRNTETRKKELKRCGGVDI